MELEDEVDENEYIYAKKEFSKIGGLDLRFDNETEGTKMYGILKAQASSKVSELLQVNVNKTFNDLLSPLALVPQSDFR